MRDRFRKILSSPASAVATLARRGKERRAANRDFERLFNLSLDLLCVSDARGYFHRVNPAFSRVLGYAESELVGKPVISFIHPDDRDATRGEVRGLASGRQSMAFVNRYRCSDGTYRWLSWSAAPPVDGFIYAVARDITERRRQQAALQESEERYRLVVRASRDAVYDWDIESGRLLFDGSFSDTLGYPFADHDTHITWWTGLLHPDDRARIDATLMAAIESGAESWNEQYRFRRGDGVYCEILDRGVLMRDADGVAYRMIGTMADITDRSRLEQQLRQSQKMEAIGRLAGGIAHDFNNLLTAISGFSNLLLDDMDSGDRRRIDVMEIAKAADRATALTRNLLAFSRRQVLRPSAVDVNSVIRDMGTLLRRVIVERIDIVTQLDGEVRLVQADRSQLEQVILNLALNARDAMVDGGVLTIRTANARLEPGRETWIRSHGDYSLISISDTGTGMDEETRAHLFEPFYTTKATGEGTGLGLATVYGIVKQTGGHIFVESERGVGTTFRIYLPQASEAPLAPQQATTTEAEPDSGGGETILVVDDEESVRLTTKRILERSGYEVLTAVDGLDGLRVAVRHGNPIPLVITDVVMPRVDGPMLAERLRKHYPGIQVIFVSGYTEQGIRKHGVLAEGTTFMQKPFTREALLSAVSRMLEPSRSPA